MADKVPALPPGFVLQRQDRAPALPEGFQIAPAGGRHLSFEEGQALLDQEAQDERLAGASGTLGAAGTGYLEGAPVIGPAILGVTQRGAAALSSAINGKSYDENLQDAQRITERAQEAHPVATTVGNVAGAVAGTAPLVAAAPAAFGVGASSVPAAMLASGGSGAAISAADSAVRSGGDAMETAKGAGVGLALGAAGPLVGNLIGRGYRAVVGNRSAAEAARIAGTDRSAIDAVSRALAADDAVGGVNANIAAAGPRAMLADAGPSTLSVLDTAIQRGGPQAGRASQRVGARAAGAADDINAALDNALGTPQGMVRPLEELRTATQPARAAAYDAAYAQPINYAAPQGMALEQMVRQRVPASVITRANNLMRINGEQSQQILARVADDGTVTFERLPDVRQLDYITRALNDVARAGDGAGALGGNTAEGRAYGGLAREMRGLLGRLVPEYRTALDTAAEPIAQREATLFGQRLMSPAVARDEVEGFVAGLSNAELTSLRGGIRSRVAETLANVKRAVSDGNVDARQGVAALRELSSDAAREKLATVLGQREADAMLRAVDEAARSFDVRAGVATNSRTYARQAAQRAVEQSNAPGLVETAASGRPVATAQGFLQSLFGTGEAAQLARQDATWGEIANLLTQPANAAQGTLLRALQEAAGRLPTIEQNAVRIGDAVTRGGAYSAAPTRRLLQKD